MNALFVGLLFLSILGLIIGLIKPETVKLKSRSKVGLVFGIAIIVCFILISLVAPKQVPPVVAPVSTLIPTPVPVATTPQAIKQPSPVVVKHTTPATTVPVTTTQPTPPAPAPVQTQTDNQSISPTSNETVSQKNAVEKAMEYLNYSGFSHDGLVAQLEYDQFSQADAVYGADNSGANWDEQAAKKAQEYMSYSAFSRDGLIQQLEYDKFTQEQAEYGANSVGL